MNNISRWHTLRRQERVSVVALATYLTLFVFGQLTRQSTNDLIWYASDILVIVWLTIHYKLIPVFLKNVLMFMKNHPLTWVLVAWSALTLVIGIITTEQIRPVFLILRLCTYLVFAGTVAEAFVHQRPLLRALLLLTGVSIAWLGLLQYFLMPDTRFLMVLGWDDHYFRMIGTMLDPNFLGILFVLTSLIAISLTSRVRRSVLLTILSLLAICIALTYSRSSYVAYALALVLTICIPSSVPFRSVAEKLGTSVLLGLVFIIALTIAPKPGGEGVKLLRTASVEARVFSSASYLTSQNSWLTFFGNGLFIKPLNKVTADNSISEPIDQAPDVTVFFSAAGDITNPPNHSQTSDNLIVTLFSGLGIFGTLASLACFLIIIHDLSKREMIAAIGFVSVLMHAQFNNTLFEPFIFQYLLLFILAPLPTVMRIQNNFRSARRRPALPG